MNVMWWNSWWNLRTKKLHESAHLEAMKEYQWMLCDDILDEIKEEKTVRKSAHWWGHEGVWMNVIWWNSWWNLRTKELHKSAHLEAM